MENGSFQNLSLTEIDFAEIDERPAASKAFKKPAHQILDFTEIPRDIRKSTTVEALISQNEDLMARLKVTLRRMTSLEDENKKMHEERTELKRSYASVSDQMLVWKEKEKAWNERHSKLENEIKVFQSRFPEFEKMEAQIDRLKRYQERVKSTIRPYLQQLKDYAQSLHQQIQSLNQELNIKEAKISNFVHQIESIKEERDQQIRFYQMSQNDLVSGFEKEKELLRSEIQALRETNEAMELRTQNLDRSLERQDELENLVVSLRRSKEDFQLEIQEEIEGLRNQNRELKQKLTEHSLAQEDLQKEREQLKKELVSHESKRDQLEEQMTSLRYMWTAKSEENEKLRISITSLEKLNLELSSKLNELRKQS